MDTVSNLLQIWSADLKGFAFAVFLACAISLAREAMPESALSNYSGLWYWLRVCGGGVALVLAGAIWWLGSNAAMNGSFSDANKHWGTGYYEDLLRNGNFDKPETYGNYKKVMASYPYVLHMPRPARPADTFPVSSSSGELGYAPYNWPLGWLGGHRSFRMSYDSDPGEHRWGTLSQRLCNLTPHRNYRVRFLVRAEQYTPGALFVTAHLNWKSCLSVEVEKLNRWESKTCVFETGDTDQADLRFVVKDRARLWLTNVDVRRE